MTSTETREEQRHYDVSMRILNFMERMQLHPEGELKRAQIRKHYKLLYGWDGERNIRIQHYRNNRPGHVFKREHYDYGPGGWAYSERRYFVRGGERYIPPVYCSTHRLMVLCNSLVAVTWS